MSADELLTCGSLTVRSRQASERSTVAASNRVILNKAVYRTNGIPSPELKLNGNLIKLSPVEDFQHAFTTESNCPAVFFDQTSYMFSIQFPKETVSAWVFSPLAKWYINSDWDAESNKLLIPINFGNDLGDFELCWEWKSKDGEINTSSFSGQVFSTKLDIYDHFRIMLDEVQERFDWIRLDILKQTSWGWAYDAGSSKNYKTWLLIFQEVRLSMEEKLQKLIFQHRKRLISESRKLKAERINKINPKFEEKIGEGILQQPNRLYSVQRKVLDSDTPENRYIKHILSQTIEQLNDVLKKIESNDEISDIFKTRLGDWAGEWGNLQQHRFWRGIGNFHGLRHESKILSQDPLYAGIRRSWYLLQNGLKFLNNDLHGGIQNAAQLYEIWCLIKVDQIIREVGWISVEDQPIFFNNEENSFDNKGNILPSGSVKFNFTKPSSSDVKLSLLFQPTAGCTPAKNGLWDGITAVPVTQRPDIVLRLHRDDLPQKPIYTWIFDAKYRLNGNDAPDDAINQMHQYRDAILWAGDTAGVGHLIRESVGAFALYPGIEDEINIESKQIVSI
ncbi:MAG: DUF2357 domain-containing protein, partial [Bacteroidetes bacterium]|nr:DUF2357 domain-containing protein [Bacteroidota bacterium]